MLKEDVQIVMWFTKEDDDELIAQGTIVVTDSEKFDALHKELRNLDTYISCGGRLFPGSSKNYVKYTSEGAVRYQNYYETAEYNSSHYEFRYINHRAIVHNLMFSGCSDWLKLFSTIDEQNSRENQIKRFEEARNIIKML